MLQTVRDVVDAFGGTTKTAKLFESEPSAVSNWIARDRFPARLHMRIWREAQREEIQIAPHLIGDEAESEPKPAEAAE